MCVLTISCTVLEHGFTIWGGLFWQSVCGHPYAKSVPAEAQSKGGSEKFSLIGACSEEGFSR